MAIICITTWGKLLISMGALIISGVLMKVLIFGKEDEIN